MDKTLSQPGLERSQSYLHLTIILRTSYEHLTIILWTSYELLTNILQSSYEHFTGNEGLWDQIRVGSEFRDVELSETAIVYFSPSRYEVFVSTKEVRWLSVDGHSVDGHYVICHLGRITIRNDSYLARLLGHILMTFFPINVTYITLL